MAKTTVTASAWLACACTALGACLYAGHLDAQTPAPLTDVQVSQATENPFAQQIVLPFRYETGFDNGPFGSTDETFKLANGVVPFVLDPDWALITRTSVDIQPNPPQGSGRQRFFGLDNSYTTFFFSPLQGQRFFWGVGPVLYYPTGTDRALGGNRWAAGPSAGAVLRTGPWQFAFIANNVWSFGNTADGQNNLNSLLLNPAISYQFGRGWSLGSSPVIKANWLAPGGQQWTVPVGASISKAFHICKQPLKLALAAYYNAERPVNERDTWIAQFTFTVLIP